MQAKSCGLYAAFFPDTGQYILQWSSPAIMVMHIIECHQRQLKTLTQLVELVHSFVIIFSVKKRNTQI